MVSDLKKVDVKMLGYDFTLRSDKGEDYVQALADYVAQRFDEIRKQTRMVSTHHIALLTALNIADELFQKQSKFQGIRSELKHIADGALKQVEGALSLIPPAPKNQEKPN